MNKEFEDILKRVSELYRKYGIKSVTMDDVAHELGISKKTLYQFVSDKTELVRMVVEHVRGCNFSAMKKKEWADLNAIEELIEVSQHLNSVMKDHSPTYEYDLKKYYPDIYRNLMSARRKLMYESMIANIRKGKKEGIYREELDEKIIAKLHLLRIENLQSTEIFDEEEMHTQKFFREVFVYHIHGLATDKGLEILRDNIDRLAMPKEH
jgi:AcrR family transcriptional regulator